MSIKEEFNKIFYAWDNCEPIDSVYNMIVVWMDKNYKLNEIHEINDIYCKILYDDPAKEIVDDFICNDKYNNFRNIIYNM